MTRRLYFAVWVLVGAVVIARPIPVVAQPYAAQVQQAVNNLINGITSFAILGMNASGYVNFGTARSSSGYGIRDSSGTIQAKNSGGSWVAIAPSGGSAPADAGYWVDAANATLTAERNLGALSTGLVLNTAGVPSAYAGTSCTNQFPRSVNASGAATCASVAVGSDLSGLGGANRIPYASSATALTTATTFVFTGTNFGVGLTDPDVLIEVSKANSNTTTNSFANQFQSITNTDTTANNLAFLTFRQGTQDRGPGVGGMFPAADEGHLIFIYDPSATGMTEGARLTSAGNFGIGNTAPGGKLDIAGAVHLGANTGSANPLAWSGAAPTISSGFGTTPSVTGGTSASFRVNVGTGGSASSGVIAMPTATTGWNCRVENLTAVAANRADQRTVQTASAAATVTVQNQTISTGAALAWTASDILSLICTAY